MTSPKICLLFHPHDVNINVTIKTIEICPTPYGLFQLQSCPQEVSCDPVITCTQSPKGDFQIYSLTKKDKCLQFFRYVFRLFEK